MALPAALRDEVEAVYRDVDQAVRALGVACWVRGDCCDFERSEHRLYASTVEIAYTREKHPAPFPGGSVLCPFWRQGKCTERERRPLGCRTYFCDARYRDQLQDLYEQGHRRLRRAAERHDFPWAYVPFAGALRRAPEHGESV